MIIERLHIEGYGIFFEKEIGGFGKGINILCGKNEAGKSTLLDFIRMTLLGYPRRTTDRRPPLRGGTHGGRIWLKTRQDEPLQIYRSGKRGLQFIYRDEKSADEELLGRLIGHATPDLYKNIYAVTIDELNDIGLLNQSGVEDKLFSMGMGLSVDFGAFENGLKEHAESYFKAGGSKQRLIRLVNEIETRQGQIRELRGKLDQYNQLTETLQALREEQESADMQRGKALRLINRFTAYQKAYPHFISYQDAVKHLEEMGERRSLPAQLLDNYEELKRKSGYLKSQLDQSSDELAAMSGKIDGIRIDKRLAENARLLDYFRTHVKVFEQALEEQKVLARKITDADAEMASVMERLGEPYEKEALLKTAGTLHLRNSGNQAAEQWLRLDSARGRTEDRIKKLELEKGAARKKLQDIREEMAALSVSDEEKLEAALKYQAALDTRFRTALSAGDGTAGSGNRIMYITALVLSLVLAGSGIFFLRGLPAVTWVLILAGISGLLVALLLSGKKKAGASAPADANALNQELRKLENEIDDYRTYKKHEKELLADLEILDRDLEKEQVSLKKLEQEQEENKQQWQAVLTRNGLPGYYPPQHIGDLIREIDKLKTTESQKQEALRKIASHKETIRKFEESLSGVGYRPRAGSGQPADSRTGVDGRLPDQAAAAGPVAGRFPDDPGLAGSPAPENVQEVHALIRRLEENEKKQTERQVLLEQLEKEKSRSEKLKSELSGIKAEMQKILEEAAAENETALYRYFEDQRNMAKLDQQILDAESNIKSLCGHEQFEETLAFLSDQHPEGLSDALRTYQDDYGRADARYSELNREVGSKEQALKSLLEPDEMFGLQNQVETLKTRLGEETREWLAAKMALKVLSESKQRYEEEKQPAVITASREYFKDITDAEYVGLKVSISEKHISLQDHQGRSKTVGELSRGTKEQLLLAIRMGLIAEYEKSTEPLPVVLDDVMVNFDPERAGNTARVLSEFARDRQVILFTCHPATIGLFREYEPNVLEW